MAIWSSFRKFTQSILQNNVKKTIDSQNVKFSVNTVLRSGHDGPKLFPLGPSRWQWHKFKDMTHLYFMVGAIPCGLVIFYCNVFIGPAKLQPIPEGYTPKHWEYYSHPITRFIARYIHNNPQQDYEKFMHYVFEEYEKSQIRRLEEEIKQKMYDRQDYQAFFYKPVTGKYLRRYQEYTKEMEDRFGDRRG